MLDLFNAFVDVVVAIENIVKPPKNELDALRRMYSEQIRNAGRYSGKKGGKK